MRLDQQVGTVLQRAQRGELVIIDLRARLIEVNGDVLGVCGLAQVRSWRVIL